ncbi:G5 domain-containing protein, partial [Candidatus Micrarchaeota archaeon]|nr:G5 domain-containing protein [Candidatus Micrarchaeota archaeon]
MFDKYFSETFKRGIKRKICRTKDKALRFFRRSFMKTRIKTGELKRQIMRIPSGIEHYRNWVKAVITDHYNGFKANAVEVIHAGKAEVLQAMSTTKGKGKVIGVVTPAAGILLVCIFFIATAPYGITADGEKVEQPWVVKAGKEEVVVVEDKLDGQKVIEKVKEHYCSRESEVKAVVIEPGVDVDTKELERFEAPVKVSDVDKAVETIVKANEGEDPVMVVSTVEEVVNEKEISYDTEVKKSSKYEEGTVKVAEEGEKGVKEVTSIVKKENGEVIDSKVIGEKVTKNPESKVVIKG